VKARRDLEVIDARLRELSRRLRRIQEKQPRSAKALADVAFHLSGVHGVVPATAGEAFDELARQGLIERSLAARLRRAAGFRNVLVHEYTEIDWKIVMQVLRTGTRDLAAFGKAVVKTLE
jgi:uncharacterized protein YutE (UPF0331/DUF86 family)